MFKGKRVIVSLTSFPAAIQHAVCAIQSVLDGNVLPDKVVLYLTSEQFPNYELPHILSELLTKNSLLEIRFYEENIRSYTKLIPALKDFPNDIIVTVDDDVLYHKNMLKKLLNTHNRYPKAVIGHRVKHIQLGTPYKKWKKYKLHRYITKGIGPKFSNFQTGVGGVLYPPNCLKSEMLDSKLFMEIAPTVDDVWLWASAVANGTKVAPVLFGYFLPTENNKPHEICLRSVNLVGRSGKDVNRETLEKIIEIYPIIKERLEKANRLKTFFKNLFTLKYRIFNLKKGFK